MKDTPELTQIYFELALNVGGHSELGPMLKQSISAYLRKLNCAAGVVFQTVGHISGVVSQEVVFCLPKRIKPGSGINTILRTISTEQDSEQFAQYLRQLPQVQHPTDSIQAAVMALPGFGLLLLVKSGAPLPMSVLKSLQPINEKLAYACRACIQNARVENLVQQLQQEVREREHVQNQLAASKQRYQTIFENIQDVYYECRIRGRGEILEISPSVERLLGYSRNDLIGTAMADLYAPGAMRRDALVSLLADGYVHEQELLLQHRQGHTVYCAANAVIQQTDGARGRKIIGSLRDVSKRRMAELALEAAKDDALASAMQLKAANKELRKLHRAVEQSPATVLITNDRGDIEYVNPAFSRITGYPKEDVLGRNPRILQSGQMDPAIYDDLWKTISSGEAWEGELLNKAKDGRLFWEMAFIAPVKDDSGCVTHYIALKEDITWRKDAEARLEAAKARIEAADAARSQFLANMSHEIRTPINGIIGMLALLLKSGLNREQQDMADTARLSADALMAAMNNVLDYAKIIADQLYLESAPFDLEVLMNDIMGMVQPLREDKPIDVKLTILPGTPLDVIGDEGRLKQIVLNLVSNAIKFTERGAVSVAVESTAGGTSDTRLQVTVKDDGIGIKEAFLPRLFECFSQHDTSMSRRYGGTGMGLALCKSLVEFMDGTISARNRRHGGAEFQFTVHLGRQPNSRVRHDPAPQAVESMDRTFETTEPERSTKHILVAEDNMINQKITLKILDTLGYACTAVNNGREAVDAVAQGVYHLVLMDIQMPEMDGLEATRAIRSGQANGRGKEVPIVALTAHAMNWDRNVCLEAGMNDYLAKPVDPQQLDEALVQQLFPCSAHP